MTQEYVVKAPVVKVSIGPASGNRIARFIYRGGIVPDGVDQVLLDKLEGRRLIEKFVPEKPGPDPEAVAVAAAAEKAAADQAAAEHAAKVKAAADAKQAPPATGKTAGK